MNNKKGSGHKSEPKRCAADDNARSQMRPEVKHAPAWIGAALLGAYFVFAYLLLAVGNADYLRQWEEMNLFLPTGMFFGQCMQLPGGLLEWMGAYLVQFFYHPWIGAATYAALSTLLAWLACKSFALTRSWAPAAVAPSAMLLLAFLSQGYLIYSLRGPGMPFANLIGALLAVTCVLACRHTQSLYLRLTLMVALAVGGYPLFGFYALLATGLCALLEVERVVGQKGASRWLSAAVILVAAMAIAASPQAYHRYAATSVMPRHIYVSGLPVIQEGEFKLIVPYIVAYGLMAVAAVVAPFRCLKDGKVQIVAAILIYGAALSSVTIFKYSDKNFDLTLGLSQALMEGDWAKAQAVADANQDFTPTRLNVLLTDIALMRQGTAADRMFAYRTGSAPYVSTRSTSMRDGGAMLINYHFGHINSAYRWAMEYQVEYGSKVAYLKMMAKSALLTREYELARKYLKTLAQTKYHKAWAEKYMAYADQPELIDQDPEMKQIKQLMLFRDHIGGDGGKLESYLLPSISAMGGGTFEMFELSLQCNLIQKQLDGFMTRLVNGWPRDRRLPKHYQECVLLWSFLNKKPIPATLRIDPEMAKRFNFFNEQASRAVGSGQGQNAELFRPTFGDTYWFYFFFVNDMKTV